LIPVHRKIGSNVFRILTSVGVIAMPFISQLFNPLHIGTRSTGLDQDTPSSSPVCWVYRPKSTRKVTIPYIRNDAIIIGFINKRPVRMKIIPALDRHDGLDLGLSFIGNVLGELTQSLKGFNFSFVPLVLKDTARHPGIAQRHGIGGESYWKGEKVCKFHSKFLGGLVFANDTVFHIDTFVTNK
jgi:hypothetical protein